MKYYYKNQKDLIHNFYLYTFGGRDFLVMYIFNLAEFIEKYRVK